MKSRLKLVKSTNWCRLLKKLRRVICRCPQSCLSQKSPHSLRIQSIATWLWLRLTKRSTWSERSQLWSSCRTTTASLESWATGWRIAISTRMVSERVASPCGISTLTSNCRSSKTPRTSSRLYRRNLRTLSRCIRSLSPISTKILQKWSSIQRWSASKSPRPIWVYSRGSN